MSVRSMRVALAATQATTAAATLYLLGLLVASARRRGDPDRTPRDAQMRIAVLVPAHNEEDGVGSVVRSLLAQRYDASRREVVVIADNCSDATADVAAAAGATVWERDEPESGGKGQALAWALERLWSHRPDVEAVAIVDADCVASPNLLEAMDRALRSGMRAVQTRYVVSNPDASPTAALRCAGFALMHIVRPRGKQGLGLSCGLFGTGMAFRAELLREQPWTAFSVTEDVEYHLRLVAAGETVAFVDDAYVASPMPTTAENARQQQLRWETGNARLVREATLLLAHGVQRRDWRRVATALDYLVPAQSLLAAGTALAGVSGLLVGSRRLALAGVLTAAGQALYVVGGLLSVRAPRSVWMALLHAPELVAAKLLQSARIATGRGADRWVRTARD
jgi:cellulose synthase/poly-beta-1,6-N-acetylglucosamine synthase-like glycosyltransferase